MSEELPGLPQFYAVLIRTTGPQPAWPDAGHLRWAYAAFAACTVLGAILIWVAA